MSESVEGLQPLLSHLVGMARRAARPRPAIAQAVDHAVKSVRSHIEEGGRPSVPLAPSTVRERGASGPILIRSRRLLNSFRPVVRSTWGAAVSNVIYGPRQHFGYAGGPGRGHAHTPARAFAFLDDEDVVFIGDRVFLPFIIYG